MDIRNLLSKIKGEGPGGAQGLGGSALAKVLDPNSLVRRKQKQLIVIALIVIIGLAWYLNSGGDTVDPEMEAAKAEQLGRDTVKKNFGSVVSSSVTDEDIWLTIGTQQLEAVKKEQERLEKQQKELAGRLKEETIASTEETRKSLEQSREDMEGSINSELEKLKKMVEDLTVQNRSIKTELEETKIEQERREVESRKPIIVSNRFFEEGSAQAGAGAGFGAIGGAGQTPGGFLDADGNYVDQPQGGMDFCNTGCGETPAPVVEEEEKKVVPFNSYSFVKERPVEVAPVEAPSNRLNVDSYIPTSTHIPAVMLSGLEAPTGGSAQNNPHPVLLLIDDFASLPNRYQYNFKECRLLAHAWGDISSERAMLRTEAISCVDHDGNVLEKEIKAHIFGEDGKPGVRGQVVVRSGQALMRGVLAGVASGIGNAFQSQAMSYATSPLGTTSTIDPDEVGMAGVGTGLATGLDRLADFYMDLVDTIMPVIEVGSQRTVDVVLAQGLDLLVNDDVSAREIQPVATSDSVGLINQADEMLGAKGLMGGR